MRTGEQGLVFGFWFDSKYFAISLSFQQIDAVKCSPGSIIEPMRNAIQVDETICYGEYPNTKQFDITNKGGP